MPEHQELKDQARTKTRSLLSQSQSFLSLDRAEQMALYRELSGAHYNELAEAQGLATAMVTAGDLINEDRHKNDRIDTMNKTLAEGVKKVDFPGFVRDLLNGVFDANLNANIRQMEAFQNLLKSATQSLSQFVNAIDDNEALMRLVESNNQYKLKMVDAQAQANKQRGGRRRNQAPNPNEKPDEKPDEKPKKAILLDQNGKEVNMNDSAIQAKILDAKLAMAKERRTMLRETILMGVSRLVVEKGIIRASVKFKIDASENTLNIDDAEAKQSNSFTAGWKAGIFGGPQGSITRTSSQISVASSETEMESKSSTELEGFVEIQFKSDYFKLDNFRETFDLGAGQVPQAQAPAQQLPPATSPAAPAQ